MVGFTWMFGFVLVGLGLVAVVLWFCFGFGVFCGFAWLIVSIYEFGVVCLSWWVLLCVVCVVCVVCDCLLWFSFCVLVFICIYYMGGGLLFGFV